MKLLDAIRVLKSLSANAGAHFDETDECLQPEGSLSGFEPYIGLIGRGVVYVVAYDRKTDCMVIRDFDGHLLNVFTCCGSWEAMTDSILAWFSSILCRIITRGPMDTLMETNLFAEDQRVSTY